MKKLITFLVIITTISCFSLRVNAATVIKIDYNGNLGGSEDDSFDDVASTVDGGFIATGISSSKMVIYQTMLISKN